MRFKGWLERCGGYNDSMAHQVVWIGNHHSGFALALQHPRTSTIYLKGQAGLILPGGLLSQGLGRREASSCQ